MQEFWGMWGTPLLPSLASLHWSRVVAPDKILCRDQIELHSVVILNLIVWNSTVFDIYTVYLC